MTIAALVSSVAHAAEPLAERLRRWREARSEDPFVRARRLASQRVCTGLLPLACFDVPRAIDKGPRPGTLTITVGDECVTLDPLDSKDKFLAAYDRVGELLDQIRAGAKP